MKGRRIPVRIGLLGRIATEPYAAVTQPGDYYGPDNGEYTDGVPAVWFLLPTATPSDPLWGGAPQDGLHHVQSPPHRFVEELDGTLSIYESIGAGPSGNYYWHGYLKSGEWKEC